MSMKSILAAGGLAGAALVLSAGAALASPGMATASVHVRSGPSTGYPVVDSLYNGERVDIGQCRGGWCYVSHSGPDGWVSGNYLARQGGPVYRRPAPPPTIIVRPPVFHPPHHWEHRPPPHHWNPPHHDHGHMPPPPSHGGHMGPPPGHNSHDGNDMCRMHPDWRVCQGHGSNNDHNDHNDHNWHH